jgi:ubiquinone/menaquinone biosynthesis C-methylase UbiE
MRHEEYRAMFELEDHLWWYQGMRAVTASILDPHLPARPDLFVLDVGCGTGYSLKWLRKKLATREAFGVDISPHASAFWNEHGLTTAAIGSAHQIPLESGTFDLVTCFDVIYQLPGADAKTAIAEMHRVLKPGGLLFIREPAYDWMRGGHDVAVATDHRYTLRKLKLLLTAQDFTLRRATYANSLLFGAAVPQLISK